MSKADTPLHLIIPAAGLGTRMKGIDPDLPKELLPLGEKTVIDYAVEEGIAAGIRSIILIINENKDSLRSHIEKACQGHPSLDITCCYQKEPLGESDAISYAAGHTGNDAVAVIYPDNVFLPAPGALKSLLPVFRKHGKDVIALSEVTESAAVTISNAGRVDLTPLERDLFLIDRFIPKSPGHFEPRGKSELRGCGIYISGPWLFHYIEKMRSGCIEGEFTDYPVRVAILHDRGMLGYRVPGTVHDVGNPQGYALCQSCLRG